MSQLATIFEKIKEDFFENHLKQGDREEYKLIFSPFSTGFSYDDFLFLDSNMASEDAHKYMDELLEFSQIANTIPREANYWAVSDHDDYLFIPYKNILSSLRLIDMDSLEPAMLYEHSLFDLALSAVNEELSKVYKPFYDLRVKLIAEISDLEKSLTDANRNTIDLEIRLKRENLTEVENKWVSEGKKIETEAKLLEIIKDEFDRFMQRFIDTKARMNTLVRDHAGSGSTFYLTSCTPNNLYKSDGLEWKKIQLSKTDIQKLLKKLDGKEYQAIMGNSGASQLEVDSISFELLFVNVTRAWLDETVLAAPFWDINILNREEIDIPRITSKLVFVRNVDVKLPQHSNKNKVLLQQATLKNLGPFILNTKSLKAGQNLQLNSVNKSLQVDRKTVLNVGAKLQTKQKNKDSKNLIANKQMQFVKLAPKLQQFRAIKGVQVAQPKAASKAKFNPVLLKKQPVLKMTALLNFVQCKFHFMDKASRTPVRVQGVNITIYMQKQNNLVDAKFKVQGSHTLITTLSANTKYKLVANVTGYRTQEYPFQAIVKGKNKVFQKTIWLEKTVEASNTNEAFQLIGVISKEISPFPNPLQGADYL